MADDFETLHRGRFLQVLRRDNWEYVSRINASGAVHILAVTPDDELLMVSQFRPPIGCEVLELPAGIVGDDEGHDGESPEQAAARELVEETGYRARTVERLYDGPSSPGLTAEITTVVRAHELTRVGEGGGVGNENIRVLHVPLAEVREWLAARVAEGRYIDHKVYGALFFLTDSVKS